MDNLLYYRDWSRIILEFEMELMYDKSPDKSLIFCDDNYIEDKRILDEIEEAYVKKNKTSLKRFFKYSTIYASEKFYADEKCLLNARLRAACGEDLTKYDKRLANSINRIVKRGKIRGGEEYEKVRTYIDSIEGEPGQETLLNDLYRLVGEFEMSVGDNPSLVGEEWR